MKKKLSIFVTFSALAFGIAFVVALMLHSFYYKQEHTLLEMRLREKVNFINRVYSILTAQALESHDDLALIQVIEALEADPEITSVVVVDEKQEIRYHAEPKRIGSVMDDKQVASTIKTGDGGISASKNGAGASLVLISPLKVQGQAAPIGAIRIEMTYHLIENQIKSSESNLPTIFLGLVMFALAIMNLAVNQQISSPLRKLHGYIAGINPAVPEANIPESPDSFGQVNIALNDLILRFKAEWQTHQSHSVDQAEQEKNWVQLFAKSFLTNVRLLAADKDNGLISDSANGEGLAEDRKHLLDLITDANFATLVNAAPLREGEVVRGPVSFDGQSYEAAVLSIPGHQSLLVKTLIALTPAPAGTSANEERKDLA